MYRTTLVNDNDTDNNWKGRGNKGVSGPITKYNTITNYTKYKSGPERPPISIIFFYMLEKTFSYFNVFVLLA